MKSNLRRSAGTLAFTAAVLTFLLALLSLIGAFAEIPLLNDQSAGNLVSHIALCSGFFVALVPAEGVCQALRDLPHSKLVPVIEDADFSIITATHRRRAQDRA